MFLKMIEPYFKKAFIKIDKWLSSFVTMLGGYNETIHKKDED